MMLQCQKNDEYGKAIADFNETRRLHPRSRFCFRRDFRTHGALSESKGEYDNAIADYSEVIQSFKPGTADDWRELVYDYFTRARAYRLKGDFDNAIADYSESIQRYPTTTLAGCGWQPTAAYYKCRAQAYYDKDDFTSAIADLTEAIRRDPKGRWSISQGDCRCIGPDPGEEGWTHKHALVTLAVLHARTGDFDHAIQDCELFLQLPDLTAKEATDGLRCLRLCEAQRSTSNTPS